MQASLEDEALRGLDGPQLALDLHRRLGPNLARVAALRTSGAELKAIAEDQQVAISTAHQRVAMAVKRVRKQVRKHRIGPDTLRPMLANFGESLIRDRIRAGLTRVKATGRTRSGKAVGRPRRNVDLDAVAALRAEGRS